MQPQSIRLSWIKILYFYTLLGAGGFGLLILIAPQFYLQLFAIPAIDPFFLGAIGSVFLAFGVIAAIGLRSPLSFAPIFLVQMAYKVAWFAFVFFPHLLQGSIPLYAWIMAVIFLSYIILDIIAIPFQCIFSTKALTSSPMPE